ncbi:MAG: hypothetical protein SFX73_08255 [Kofleriaceae bacterium]|nr:hypothetical protein [Kofleriaceae bacterium]
MAEDVLHHLAHRYVRWQPANVALANRTHFLCQLMQLGTAEDVRAVRDLLGDEALRSALRAAPPGVLDARSWNFWHLFLFHTPPPPMPSRPLPP